MQISQFIWSIPHTRSHILPLVQITTSQSTSPSPVSKTLGTYGRPLCRSNTQRWTSLPLCWFRRSKFQAPLMMRIWLVFYNKFVPLSLLVPRLPSNLPAERSSTFALSVQPQYTYSLPYLHRTTPFFYTQPTLSSREHIHKRVDFRFCGGLI